MLIRWTATFSQSQCVDAVVLGPRDLKMKMPSRDIAKQHKKSMTVLSLRQSREMEESPGNTNSNTQYVQESPVSSNFWWYGSFHTPNQRFEKKIDISLSQWMMSQTSHRLVTYGPSLAHRYVLSGLHGIF